MQNTIIVPSVGFSESRRAVRLESSSLCAFVVLLHVTVNILYEFITFMTLNMYTYRQQTSMK